MSDYKADQVYEVLKGAKRNLSCDFTDALDSGEVLTGTPTVVDEGTGLTPTSPQVNTAALTILGVTVAIGKAVTFNVDTASATNDTLYTFKITVTTDNGQTLVGEVLLKVI